MFISLSFQVTLLGINTPFGPLVDKGYSPVASLVQSCECAINPSKRVHFWRQHQMPDLTGKVAIVTGASRGIGAAAALALGKAGASVMLAARSLAQAEANAEEINRAGGKAFALDC